MTKILVFAEHNEGKMCNYTKEAIDASKQINNLVEIVCVLLGKEVDHLSAELELLGANRVIMIENEQYAQYHPETYTQLLLDIIETESPNGIIFGQTTIGKDLASRIAIARQTSLISD